MNECRCVSHWLQVAAVALLCLIFPAVSSAAPVPLVPAVAAQTAPAEVSDPVADIVQPVTILIELIDAPTVRTWVAAQARSTAADASTLAQAQLQQIEQAQQTLLSTAALADADVIYRVQRVYNGVAVRVDSRRLDEIAALPGVRAIHPLPTYNVELVRTVPFIGAPVLWDHLRAAGVDGSSISIGIVDTGIDYLHKSFGGSGTGYVDNDTTRIDDLAAFPSAKIVGGFDFVGDNYNANSFANALPAPDPDPMDCWGHGTHVAGIAAGYGLLSAGSTYTGTYTSDLSFAQFSIGPGVAPQARLYALKVFGCLGSSQIVEQAVEWAVDPNQDGDFSDRLDVLNLSLGSSFGAPSDPTVVAVDNAALAGVVVVAAAGNTGDTYYITSAPGVAARAISVAASSTQGLPAPKSTASTIDSVATFSARGPRRGDSLLKPDISAPGVSVVSAAALSGSGRQTNSGTSMATPHVAGAAALLLQIHPNWTPEEIKALLLNSARYDLFSGDSYPPLRYGLGRAGTGRLDLTSAFARDLLFYSADNSGAVSVSFGAPSVSGDTTLLQTARLVNKSDRTQHLFLDYVPVVDQPGVEVAVIGSAERTLEPFGSLNIGVSLNAVAAEMRTASDATVAQRNNFPRHRLSEEAGYVFAWPQPTLLRADLVAVDSADGEGAQWDASFTLEPSTGVLSYTLSISAAHPLSVNAASLRFGSAYTSGPVVQSLLRTPIDNVMRVQIEDGIVLSRDEMALLAGGNFYVSIELNSDSAGASEVRGQLEVETPVTRLPVYAAPRPASLMRSGLSMLDLGTTTLAEARLPLVGNGLLQAPTLAQGRFPTDTVSIVSALELQLSSPKLGDSQDPYAHADLQYVGIAVNPSLAEDATTPVDKRRIVFGIVTYGAWSTPNEISFRIQIDTDENGTSDYVLSTTNLGSYLGIGMTDEFVTVLEAMDGTKHVTYFVNLISAAELNTALFNNNVLLMAVDAKALGLSEASSTFRYFVSAYSRDPEDSAAPIDFSPPLRYDVANPGISVGAGALGDLPIFYDLPGASLDLRVDQTALYRNRSQGLLLLHHHNVAGQRAEVIAIQHDWRSYLPIVSAP